VRVVRAQSGDRQCRLATGGVHDCCHGKPERPFGQVADLLVALCRFGQSLESFGTSAHGGLLCCQFHKQSGELYAAQAPRGIRRVLPVGPIRRIRANLSGRPGRVVKVGRVTSRRKSRFTSQHYGVARSSVTYSLLHYRILWPWLGNEPPD
jgi:hypothetical protein